MNRIYITVENGILIHIASTNPDELNVTIVDWDDVAEDRVRLYENYAVSLWREKELIEAIANVRARLTKGFRKITTAWTEGPQ